MIIAWIKRYMEKEKALDREIEKLHAVVDSIDVFDELETTPITEESLEQAERNVDELLAFFREAL